jgi:hypothetical protein
MRGVGFYPFGFKSATIIVAEGSEVRIPSGPPNRLRLTQLHLVRQASLTEWWLPSFIEIITLDN